MDSTTPLDELAGFLSGNSAASISPQNPLGQNASPSANPSNPAMNKDMPGAWTNPSNPELNPSLPNAVTNPSNPQYNPSMPGATNNPSNYAYNPQMPGSMTNPASPKLNPNYPGSLMNPANPIHNPGFPVHQEVPRPPGLSENASLPPAHASWHAAGQWKPWQLGEFGKGFITPMGNVIHWRTDGPDGYPSHFHGLAQTGYGSPHYLIHDAPEANNFFEVTPDGYVVPSGLQTPEGYQKIVQSHPQFTNQLPESVDPFQRSIRNLMQEHPDWDWAEYTQTYPNEAQYWKTADNYTQDTREWADPTEPRADSEPMPHGCTCRNGTDSQLKLYCPVHGLDGQWEKALDWSIPEGHPVGYPQDGPRGWVDAVHSSLAGQPTS